MWPSLRSSPSTKWGEISAFCSTFKKTGFGIVLLRCCSEVLVPAAELHVHLSSRCWSNSSPGQTFPGVFSDFQHRLSGSRCYKQFWSATFCLFLNLDIKPFINTQAFTEQRSDLLPAPRHHHHHHLWEGKNSAFSWTLGSFALFSDYLYSLPVNKLMLHQSDRRCCRRRRPMQRYNQ